VRELQTLVDTSRLSSDLREARFAERTLQLAIQAVIDVASHAVSDERLGEPRTNRELFDLLARGWGLPSDLAQTLHRMAGFRNILVHGNDEWTLLWCARTPTRGPVGVCAVRAFLSGLTALSCGHPGIRLAWRCSPRSSGCRYRSAQWWRRDTRRCSASESTQSLSERDEIVVVDHLDDRIPRVVHGLGTPRSEDRSCDGSNRVAIATDVCG